ncbi:hypothetical protein GGI06_000402 [Coemansia sp. S85]|nr:hypothetical protein GGI06_000402 [Coemansia sp. S85]
MPSVGTTDPPMSLRSDLPSSLCPGSSMARISSALFICLFRSARNPYVIAASCGDMPPSPVESICTPYAFVVPKSFSFGSAPFASSVSTMRPLPIIRA